MKTRDVVCMKKLGENLFAVVDEENCQGKQRPVTEKPCPELEPCPADWFNTKWSQVFKKRKKITQHFDNVFDELAKIEIDV